MSVSGFENSAHSHLTGLSDPQFALLKQIILMESGIVIAPEKRAWLETRLVQRLRAQRSQNYGDYLDLLMHDETGAEKALLVDAIASTDTRFYREEHQLEVFAAELATQEYQARSVRTWCAGVATGQEAYSVAMTLEDVGVPLGWQLVATDINGTALSEAKRGLYAIEQAKYVPRDALQSYCLKGSGKSMGQFCIGPYIRQKVEFKRHNVLTPLDQGMFDFIFLRNVMTFFSDDTRIKVIDHVASLLNEGGLLFLGHAEQLPYACGRFNSEGNAIFRKIKAR